MQNQNIIGEKKIANTLSKTESRNIWLKTNRQQETLETQNIQETTSFCCSWKNHPTCSFKGDDFHQKQSSKQAAIAIFQQIPGATNHSTIRTRNGGKEARKNEHNELLGQKELAQNESAAPADGSETRFLLTWSCPYN